jgi:hypothetical protein
MLINEQKVWKENSYEIPKGSLEEAGVHRTNIREYKIFTDKNGNNYVEIFHNPKSQIFTSNFLRRLGFLSCRVLEYVDDSGKKYTVSFLPNKESFSYDPSGAIMGWAKILLLLGLIDDGDKNVNFDIGFSDFSDSKFPVQYAPHNIHIIMGNFLLYDFGDVYDLDSVVDEKYLQRVLTQKLKEVDYMFNDLNISQYPDKKSFLDNVFIHVLSELHRIKIMLQENGLNIIKEEMRKTKVGNMLKIFKNIKTPEIFLEIVIKRLSIMEEFFAEKIK